VLPWFFKICPFFRFSVSVLNIRPITPMVKQMRAGRMRVYWCRRFLFFSATFN
jgi:hypothetical protein